MKGGFAKIIDWDDLKENTPLNINISSIVMIPHKRRSYWEILDLLFVLKREANKVASVNEKHVKLAPRESIDQMGSALARIIDVVATLTYRAVPSISPK